MSQSAEDGTDRVPTLDEMCARLLYQGKDEPREVVTLSDADLLALDGVGTDHVAPMPWLGESDRAVQELAAEMGWRQLAARGLAAVSPGPEQSVVVSLQTQAVLHMRRAASAILIAQQEASLGANTLVLYGQGRLGTLAEAVDGYGLHRFSTLAPPAALDALVGFLVPTGTFAEADGPVRVYSEAEWPEGAATLADALTVTVLSGTSRTNGAVDERRMSIYALPDRAVAALPMDAGLGVRDVTRDSVIELVRHVSGSSTGSGASGLSNGS